MAHIFDIIIIGGGPAGYTAALYAARAGFDTCVVERMSPGGQMALTSDIDNYPGFEDGIDGFELGMKMQKGAEKYGVKTQYADVLSIDVDDKIKKVNTANETFESRIIIIATGANPRELGIENEKKLIGKGIHYCAHCDGRFYKGKTVMVVGGGNSAVADALYLSRLAEKVILVHRRDTLRATKIYNKPLSEAKNIEFCWNSKVKEFILDEKIKGAVLENTITGEKKDLLCDGIFVSIGRKPATEFIKGILELDSSGYIIADETTKTSLPGVFAVGDVRTKAFRQVVTATADGAVAVHFAEEYLSDN